jgi:hypothetical protein
MTTVRLPFALGSNLVFSSDGTRLFFRSPSGELWSADVPQKGGAPALHRHDGYAAEGTAVAVGWLEDRLAVVSVRGDTLFASHGSPGVNFAPSGELRLSIAGSGLVLGGGRLEPYVRWCAEINPVEELPIAMTLVRGDDDRLFVVWQSPFGDPPSIEVVAEEVSAIAALGPGVTATTIAVGRRPARPKPPRRTLFRCRPPSPRTTAVVFELSRRCGWEPGNCSILEDERPPRAFVGYAGSHSGGGLVALERVGGGWIVGRPERRLGVDVIFEALPSGERVVGVVDDGSRRDRGALVVVDSERRRLSLVDEHRQRKVIIVEDHPVEHIAFSLVEPVAAYVRNAELCFAWLR